MPAAIALRCNPPCGIGRRIVRKHIAPHVSSASRLNSPSLPGICWMTLEFTLNHDAPATAHTDCIVVGAFADGSLTPAAQAIDGASGGRLAALLARGDVSGKTGRTAMLHDLPGVTAPRVLVIGLGETAKYGVPQYLKAIGDAARALRTGPVASALFTLSDVAIKERDETGLKAFAISGSDAAALAQGQAIAAGVAFARELGNLPPNICNPGYLAQQAQEFAARFPKAECEVLDREQMQALGM